MVQFAIREMVCDLGEWCVPQTATSMACRFRLARKNVFSPKLASNPRGSRPLFKGARCAWHSLREAAAQWLVDVARSQRGESADFRAASKNNRAFSTSTSRLLRPKIAYSSGCTQTASSQVCTRSVGLLKPKLLTISDSQLIFIYANF